MKTFLFISVFDVTAWLCCKANHHQAHETLWRAADHRKEKKTAMILSLDKSQWPIEDHPQRYSSRRKKKGQAEKEMDGQHSWVHREELCHDPSPCPGPSEVETGKSFATTQALAQDRQRWRQGRALPRPKPLPRTVRGGDREELCHDPSPCSGPSEVETGKSFATTQALAQDRQRWRQGRALPRPKPLPRTVRGGDSWCRVQQCNAPTTPGTVTGFVIVIVRQVGAGSSVFDEFKPLVPRFWRPVSCF